MVVVVVPELPLRIRALAKLSLGGGNRGLKVPALVAIPPGVLTLISPPELPAGTLATTCVALLIRKTVLMPLKVTLVAPAKLLPLMKI